MDILRIIVEQLEPSEEDHIIIKCRDVPPELISLLNSFSKTNKLIGYVDNEIHRVNPSNVYYIEAVDNRTFLYGHQSMYESKQKLYELEEILGVSDFLRISKSTIVNLSKVKALSPALSRRLEATLENNEKVIVSRQYVDDLKKHFGI